MTDKDNHVNLEPGQLKALESIFSTVKPGNLIDVLRVFCRTYYESNRDDHHRVKLLDNAI